MLTQARCFGRDSNCGRLGKSRHLVDLFLLLVGRVLTLDGFVDFFAMDGDIAPLLVGDASLAGRMELSHERVATAEVPGAARHADLSRVEARKDLMLLGGGVWGRGQRRLHECFEGKLSALSILSESSTEGAVRLSTSVIASRDARCQRAGAHKPVGVGGFSLLLAPDPAEPQAAESNCAARARPTPPQSCRRSSSARRSSEVAAGR